jgi:hypothetical protein
MFEHNLAHGSTPFAQRNETVGMSATGCWPNRASRSVKLGHHKYAAEKGFITEPESRSLAEAEDISPERTNPLCV